MRHPFIINAKNRITNNSLFNIKAAINTSSIKDVIQQLVKYAFVLETK